MGAGGSGSRAREGANFARLDGRAFRIAFGQSRGPGRLVAVSRSGRSRDGDVGLLRPWIVFSPHLARQLDEGQVNAVLEHERAHARHWDPLRIWLAQLAADLQWPWPQAHERLRRWLLALELARDQEARATGVEGPDLAEAIVASARFDRRVNLPLQAALTGEASALKQRIVRLLDPLPSDWEETQMSSHGPLVPLLACVLLALVLGLMFGERVVRALFWIAA
jgi:beta-lactamase regulating signal transducer with metallopeptidase domain